MNLDSILIIEHERVDSLYPFSVMHCYWELRCGALRIFEKIQNQFPNANLLFFGRDLHQRSFLARNGISDQSLSKGDVLVYNSLFLPSKSLWANIENAWLKATQNGSNPTTLLFVSNRIPVACYIPKNELPNPSSRDINFLPRLMFDFAHSLPIIEIDKPSEILHLWDTFELNAAAIDDDSRFFENRADINSLKLDGVHSVNPSNIIISDNVKIAPGVVLDASEGKIIIGKNVRIMPNAVIIGPCFIGDNSLIKVAAKIYEKTSIGEHCKVGGEVENSIIHAYSNKQHDGFLGHSYIGEWVNLGADTNTSDLMNTYGKIVIDIDSHKIQTDSQFIGLLCGDHSKTAINSMFNTGTVVGVSSLLAISGFPPKFVPSFKWISEAGSHVYKFEKAIEVARIVMQRRNKTLLPEEEALLRAEFERIINKQ